MVGQIYELNSKRFSVAKVDTKKIHVVDENGKEFNIIVDDDDDAPKQLRLNLFAKTFDWKRHAIPIRTHEEGEPYFLGKALGEGKTGYRVGLLQVGRRNRRGVAGDSHTMVRVGIGEDGRIPPYQE